MERRDRALATMRGLGGEPAERAPADPDVKPCAICQTRCAVRPWIQGPNAIAPFRIVACRTCSLVYVDEPLRRSHRFEPLPDQTAAAAWRAQFPDALDVDQADEWGAMRQVRDLVTDRQYREVVRLFGSSMDRPGFGFLEIGAARGALAVRVAASHPRARVLALEPSPIMVGHIRAAGVPAIEGVIDDLDVPRGSLDAVVGFGVLPQLRDPRADLERLAAVLRPGGYLLLDAPNEASLSRSMTRWGCGHRRVSRLLGADGLLDRCVSLLYNPGRFFYYSPVTIARLLRLTGFRAIEIATRPARSLESDTLPMPAVVRRLGAVLGRLERRVGRQAWLQAFAIRRTEGD